MSKRKLKNLSRIIKCLCKIAPTTINAEDNRGRSPIEYAIEKEINIKIIRELQVNAAVINGRKSEQ